MKLVKASRLVLLTGVLGLTLGGCALMSMVLTAARESPWIVVGGDGQQIILATGDRSIDPMQEDAPTTTSRDVYTLDATTTSMNKILSGVTTYLTYDPINRSPIAAEGRYVAWIDPTKSDVVLYDTTLDTQARYDVQGDETGSVYFGGLFLGDGRLVVSRSVQRSLDYEYQLLIVDIASGAQTVVTDFCPCGGGFAFVGDALLMCNGTSTIEEVGFEWGVHIERIDLLTSERRFIVKDIRVPSEGSGMAAVGGRVIYSESVYADDTFNLRVHSYDVASDKLTCIIKNADPEGGYSRLRGVTPDAILLERGTGSSLTGEEQWLEYYDFTGQSLGTVQLGNTADPRWTYAAYPRTAGDWAVWIHPVNGTLELWNPTTQARSSLPQPAE